MCQPSDDGSEGRPGACEARMRAAPGGFVGRCEVPARRPLVVEDSGRLILVNEDPVGREAGVAAYLGVPLIVADQEPGARRDLAATILAEVGTRVDAAARPPGEGGPHAAEVRRLAFLDDEATGRDAVLNGSPARLFGVMVERSRGSEAAGDRPPAEGGAAPPEEDRRWLVVGLPLRSADREPAGDGGEADHVEPGWLERELHRRAEHLAEAERRKYDFLAMLAHELRNPLAAIVNALQYSMGSGQEEDREWAREVMDRQARHLSRLIDDLLDVSRVRQGKIVLRKEQVRLSAVFDRVVEAARPLMERHGHELTVAVAPGGLRIEADPTRLEQVLGNLLANAAKYTEDGGRVALTARREGAEAVIEVRDTGVGIAPEMLPRLFDLFAQADGTLDRAKGGLGVGLALVRTLVDLHGGSVSAESAGLGHGSTFTVRLPGADELPEAGPRPGIGPARSSNRGARVLVVDDNVDIARSMSRLLRRAGLEVQSAHDGLDALEAARAHRPEVVLLDIGLPGLDGYQVAERMRREDVTRDALIIAISGYGQEQDRLRSRQAGFDHHLVKPVEFGALLDLMERPRAAATAC